MVNSEQCRNTGIFKGYELAKSNSGEGGIMYTNEYGNREDPTIILLAPMMVSGENLYEIMSPHLRDNTISFSPIREVMEKPGHISVRTMSMRN